MERLIAPLVILGFSMLITVPATALLCHLRIALVRRFRIARKRQVSYGTMLLGALIVPLIFVSLESCLDPDFWSYRYKGLGPERIIFILGFFAAMNILPALGVVAHYQKRAKSDGTTRA